MALREIMKMDTSVATHRSFDQKMNSEDQSSNTATPTSIGVKTENETVTVKSEEESIDTDAAISAIAEKRKISEDVDEFECKKIKTELSDFI